MIFANIIYKNGSCSVPLGKNYSITELSMKQG